MYLLLFIRKWKAGVVIWSKHYIQEKKHFNGFESKMTFFTSILFDCAKQQAETLTNLHTNKKRCQVIATVVTPFTQFVLVTAAALINGHYEILFH